MIFSINNDFIQLRLFSEKDLEFLQKVYASTREQELKQVTDWTDEIKQAFLNQQFNAQHNYYLENYVGAKFFVIEKEKIAVVLKAYANNLSLAIIANITNLTIEEVEDIVKRAPVE